MSPEQVTKTETTRERDADAEKPREARSPAVNKTADQAPPHSPWTTTIAEATSSAATSAATSISTVAASATTAIARGAEVVVDWVEAKTEKLSATEQLDGTGPYSTPGIANTGSDLDVIATGVLPAMPSKEVGKAVESHVAKKAEKKGRLDSVVEPQTVDSQDKKE